MKRPIIVLLSAICAAAFVSPSYAELTLTEQPVKVRVIRFDNIKDLVAPETFVRDPKSNRISWEYDKFRLSGILPPIEAYRTYREPGLWKGYWGADYSHEYVAIFYEDQCVKVDDECVHVTIRLPRAAIGELTDLKPYLRSTEIHDVYIWAIDVSYYPWHSQKNEIEILIDPR